MNTIARKELNNELNGVEIYFNVYPLASTRASLKEHGFRWNHKKACWYAKQTEDNTYFAGVICDMLVDEYKELAEEAGEAVAEVKAKADKASTKKSKKSTAKAEVKANKYGVKVGDVFHASWGYDQTNNDFFQVVALVGESSVRVVEVVPALVKTENQGFMSEDRTYNTAECSRVARSVFIEDNEKGDIKRIKEGYSGAVCFKISSFANAYKVEGVRTFYESWGH